MCRSFTHNLVYADSQCFPVFCCCINREVCKQCSQAQRTALVRALGAVLTQCAGFLGSLCVTECGAALLSTAADSTPAVRSAAQDTWREVQSALREKKTAAKDAYLKVQSAYS